ncbi:hypothetical protein V8D89_007366 [Ganoderma adspersum]
MIFLVSGHNKMIHLRSLANAASPSVPEILDETSHIEQVQNTLKFIHALESNLQLADDNLDAETLRHLSDPPKAPPILTPDETLSVKLFLADTNGSDKIYNDAHSAIIERHPGDNVLLLYQVKKKIAEIMGIMEIVNDMCPNNCVGYTGPYAMLDPCLTCDEPRYTSPAARYRSPSSAHEMQFRDGRMASILAELEESGKLDEITDIYEGYDFWSNDLYEHKASNCWIYIWILIDKRFILPGAIIPGPNKPKNVDSFLFPGLHHGLVIWDASCNTTFISCPFILLAEADAIGAPDLTGYPAASHYYSVCLKPDGYNEDGCNADDYEPSDLDRIYEQRRLKTGILKLSIFLGISPHHRLSIPGLFPGDIMHLFGLNIPNLLTKLWRGTMECDVKNSDNKASWDWKQHGVDVVNASHFMPGFFDCPPRNPTEKISSRYKCWEFLNWIYGLAPAMLYTNYCKFIAGRTVDMQRQEAHVYFSDFIYEFESLYVQRKVSRMHFCPQCLHALLHTPLETYRIRPLICSSQFPIEHAIGDLGSEIRQPSNPYANLTQCALRRAQVNGLKAMFPHLDPTPPIVSPQMPHHDLRGGLALLHPREDQSRDVLDSECHAIAAYINSETGHSNTAAKEKWLDSPAMQ